MIYFGIEHLSNVKYHIQRFFNDLAWAISLLKSYSLFKLF